MKPIGNRLAGQNTGGERPEKRVQSIAKADAPRLPLNRRDAWELSDEDFRKALRIGSGDLKAEDVDGLRTRMWTSPLSNPTLAGSAPTRLPTRAATLRT